MEAMELTSVTSYWEFLKTINWQEPWLILLICFHLFCSLIILLTRGHHNIQIGMFLALLSFIFFSENINQIAANKWRLFSQEQYFDSRGLFISTILSIPVLLNCCLLVSFWLWETVGLLKICAKRLKISRQKQQQQYVQDAEKKKD